MSNWKPMLATNILINNLRLPTMVSLKLEGVRGEFTPDGLITRPMKPFNNDWLKMKFARTLAYCKKHEVTLEGEFYIHGMEFSDISSICRRKHHEDTGDMEFHAFDAHYIKEAPFEQRARTVSAIVKGINDPHVKVCEQILMNSHDDIQYMYEDAIADGYEGLVFKDPRGAYKYGRSTKNEQLYLRIKPEDTYDGVVLEIIERKENLCESEINELGYQSKRQDKDMKGATGLAAVAVVKVEGLSKPVRVSLSRGIKDYEDTKKSASRSYIWQCREEFVGRHIKFVGLPVKGMELPRSPRFDEWRTDLDID